MMFCTNHWYNSHAKQSKQIQNSHLITLNNFESHQLQYTVTTYDYETPNNDINNWAFFHTTTIYTAHSVKFADILTCVWKHFFPGVCLSNVFDLDKMIYQFLICANFAIWFWPFHTSRQQSYRYTKHATKFIQKDVCT